MNDILRQIGDYGIVPVIKIEDASKAVPLAKALAGDHALFNQGFFQALLFFLGK